jgi:solute carrier family 40 (iron-regulated transporter), member 1
MNSQMRRIDLFCKLISPLAIALIDGTSTKIAIQAILWSNVVSVVIEYALIARTYRAIPALISRAGAEDTASLGNSAPTRTSGQQSSRVLSQFWNLLQILKEYFRHPALLPSLSLSLLYLTVLSFSGQMVTYLLSSGYTSTSIGYIRSVSVVVEISATWLTPMVMNKLGQIRAGIWFLSWQTICLTVAVGLLLIERTPVWAASYLVVGVIASRIGLWGFDLCAQIIIQEVRVSITKSCSNFCTENCRKLSKSIEDPSQLLRVRCRTFSNSAPLPQRRSSLDQINFAIQR